MTDVLLQVEGLVAGYDGSRVVDEVFFEVARGETVTLLGRNGVGKTTLVESLMWMVRPARGSVRVVGTELCGRPARRPDLFGTR